MTKIRRTPEPFQSPPIQQIPESAPMPSDQNSSQWQQGLGILTNLAASGAFGSDGKKAAKLINPKNQMAAPAVAPPPAPVAGQQGVNPAASSGGFGAHMRAHWPKYAIGVGAVVAVFFGVKLLRKG